jgi:ubiquinone/menaquinone biosynthesis C-methylase UbiE
MAESYLGANVPHFERYARDALALSGLVQVPRPRVLDVACGPGTLALLAAQTAVHVDAIDFSPRMIARLKERLAAGGVKNVDARVADGQALPFAHAAYDRAYSIFGLMFFPDRAAGFAELRRVLVPGGRAAVTAWKPFTEAPVIAAYLAALVEQFPEMKPPAKAPLTDPDDFRAEMGAAGFRDITVTSVVHAMEWPDFEACWTYATTGFPWIMLLARRLGPAAFAPVAEKLRAFLRARLGDGPIRSEMPAWIGVGSA